MIQVSQGKLTAKDQNLARLLKLVPWFSFLLLSLPLPLVFFALFLTAATTESAAIYLLIAGASFGFGLLAGLIVLILLQIYRRTWLRRLRDKLAADGITARELVWFTQELTTAERKALRDMSQRSPLLADAYRETLAARLTASRIIARTDRELVKVRGRINRARTLTGATTAALLGNLESDQAELRKLKDEAGSCLVETRARLQTIEAAASRSLDQAESLSMLRRLSATQEHLPLAIEMDQLERKMLHDAELQLKEPESLMPTGGDQG